MLRIFPGRKASKNYANPILIVDMGARDRCQARTKFEKHDVNGGKYRRANVRNPDLDPDLSIDQEKGMNWLGCASVAAGATLILRCRSYNFQFFLQM